MSVTQLTASRLLQAGALMSPEAAAARVDKGWGMALLGAASLLSGPTWDFTGRRSLNFEPDSSASASCTPEADNGAGMPRSDLHTVPQKQAVRIQWSRIAGLFAAFTLLVGPFIIYAPYTFSSRGPVTIWGHSSGGSAAHGSPGPSSAFNAKKPGLAASRTEGVVSSGVEGGIGTGPYAGSHAVSGALHGSWESGTSNVSVNPIPERPAAEEGVRSSETPSSLDTETVADTASKPGALEAQLPGDSTASQGSLPAEAIIAVTPTYPRAFQELHLTRLASTIRQQIGSPFLWLVVESPFKTNETASILERTAGLCLPLGHPRCCKVDYVHLETRKVETAKVNRGVVHRNCALDYIEERRLRGIVYFMDDDNTYTPQLFDELRRVKRAGLLPVALLYTEDLTQTRHRWPGSPLVERPLVRRSPASLPDEGEELQIYGWETAEWCLPRRNGTKVREYNVDMAAFAFRSDLLWLPSGDDGYPKKPLRFAPTGKGLLENDFLLKIGRNATGSFEALADGCTEVWAFHLHMEADKSLKYPKGWFVDQPRALVPMSEDACSTWPFIVNGKRHGIPNLGVNNQQFVYS